MTTLLRQFAKDESGATAIEYALIVAAMAIGIIGSLTNLRTALIAGFATVAAGFPN